MPSIYYTGIPRKMSHEIAFYCDWLFEHRLSRRVTTINVKGHKLKYLFCSFKNLRNWFYRSKVFRSVVANLKRSIKSYFSNGFFVRNDLYNKVSDFSGPIFYLVS